MTDSSVLAPLWLLLLLLMLLQQLLLLPLPQLLPLPPLLLLPQLQQEEVEEAQSNHQERHHLLTLEPLAPLQEAWAQRPRWKLRRPRQGLPRLRQLPGSPQPGP